MTPSDTADLLKQRYGIDAGEPPVSVLARGLVDSAGNIILSADALNFRTGPQASAVAEAYGPRVPVTRKTSVALATMVALGAVGSGNIVLFNLPPRSVVLFTLLKPTAALAGGALSAATGRITTANNNYGTAFDVFQAPGNTVLDPMTTAPKAENFAAITPVRLTLALTGANAAALTAGAIDTYVTYFQLP